MLWRNFPTQVMLFSKSWVRIKSSLLFYLTLILKQNSLKFIHSLEAGALRKKIFKERSIGISEYKRFFILHGGHQIIIYSFPRKGVFFNELYKNKMYIKPVQFIWTVFALDIAMVNDIEVKSIIEIKILFYSWMIIYWVRTSIKGNNFVNGLAERQNRSLDLS